MTTRTRSSPAAVLVWVRRLVGHGSTDGALITDQFTIGTEATTPTQSVIYNSTTGALLYDADGTGSRAAFRSRPCHRLSLTATDIVF